MANDLATSSSTSIAPSFSSVEGFALANRIGTAFAASTLVPQAYRENVANCIVALEMANRMQASPLMVMQNLYIVHGNPGWSSKFLIACFNQSGRFSALRYEFDLDANKVPYGCRAWAVEKSTQERLVGSTVTLDMAKAEGWSTKQGSKWKTMPELMLQYRAAAFFVRVYAPEISMGLQTDDELADTFDAATGDLVQQPGKPEVRMPTRKAAPIPADVIDNETGEISQLSEAEAKPEVAQPESATPAASSEVTKPAANGALATEGEKKMIVTRARNNSIDMLDLLAKAGLEGTPLDLTGLTKDGFVALKEALPKAA
jgi:hypothetical protein